MKNIFNRILIVLFISSLAVGCMDELEKEPIGLLTEDIVDNDLALVTLEASVSSIYQPLKNTLNGVIPGWRWDLGTVFRNDIVLQDIASNDMNKKWNPDGDQPWMDEVGNYTFTPENQAFNGIWVYDYIGINRANLAIGFLSDAATVQSAGMTDARKNQLLSEAHFLRAYYYFDLVNNFGDVPLISATPDSFEEALAVAIRAPKEEVMNQVNSDIALAKSLATNAKYPDPAEPWRVSKGAIIALQAKVALFNENWSSVLSTIAELDALGNYSLNANYFDSFNAEMEFADNEVIFAYDHRSDETPNNTNGLRFVIGWGFFAPTDDFVAAFEANDPRLLYTTTANPDDKRSFKIIGSTTDMIDYGNKVYIRYADVLLWKAEALNETGDYVGAVDIINQIRNRARTSATADGSIVPLGTLTDRPASTNAVEILGWIMSERRVELGFESHRFNDLKRWGTAKTVLSDLGRNFQDYNYLFPIPQRDIDKSGGTITQNPGY
ncbi:RagB/SusD family nutrient uptake outer membrane protein [Arenibacter algicola]|uniref:SusD family protein n=1 Tax=Arenibacter algicola TaxID=616991 RepID=A0A221URX0_9FLAO|nr:RagB/SusD family nutrient uptake outer membrane protein [Arenibacter algicola]ASO04139.1 SusD family protein [Arenibacter algicola]MDX1767368.1 RagB/SusD family nutrient uptake outer membrane protein [Arenibacter troitsensis]|tara:strand:- start:448 stop:1932 length:1485 start_codon:yes stop_codon:yes gene_type:complete